MTKLVRLIPLILLCASPAAFGATTTSSFDEGLRLFKEGRFADAAEVLREAATREPASGVLVNLGLVEWRRGRAGPAIVAWEQARWLDPGDSSARGNLEFARRVLDVAEPELTWYEAASAWLPANYWAWLAGGSLWLAVAVLVMPPVLRLRRTSWQQAVAALGLGVFLLSLPAHIGVVTRSNLGFVLEKKTELRLTPTSQGEVLSSLPAGEPGRLKAERAGHYLIETQQGTGWVAKDRFGLLLGDH